MCSLIVPVYGSGQISLGRLPTVTFSEDNDHAMLDFCRIPDRALYIFFLKQTNTSTCTGVSLYSSRLSRS